MSTMEALTPAWWLGKLHAELADRQENMLLMDRYYVGDHPLPFLTKAHQAKMRDEFLNLLKDSRSNFMRLVVDVVEERLRVEGFRLSAASDVVADSESWRIWQANQVDAESETAFVEALVKGVSYVSVWEGDRFPTIAIEDPMQTIVGYVPGTNFRERAAALKIWRDDWTGKERANVYLPDGIHKFERTSEKATRQTSATGKQNEFGVEDPAGARSSDLQAPGGWKFLPDEFVTNPLGVVPIIPLRNRPRLMVEGESELADVFRVQNQINGFLFLLALAGYFGAHRQRWVVGLTLMEDANGKPVEPFNTAIDKLWTTDNPEAKFGEFSQTDLDGYIKAIEEKVLHIAVTTRTPRHYLIEQGQSPSGDAIKSAESGLVKKVERKQRPFGEGLEEALRLARMFAGEGDSPVDSEIVWADAEIRTEGEITDAAIKRFQAGIVTWEQTLEDLGYSQTQIIRMSGERDVAREAEQAPERDATTLMAGSVEALRSELLGAIEQARAETQDLRAIVTEFGAREPTPPPNIEIKTEISEGAFQATIAEGAVKTEISEGAIQTTVEAPPAPNVTIEAPPPANVNVTVPSGRTRRTATFSDGRSATIEEEPIE